MTTEERFELYRIRKKIKLENSEQEPEGLEVFEEEKLSQLEEGKTYEFRFIGRIIQVKVINPNK